MIAAKAHQTVTGSWPLVVSGKQWVGEWWGKARLTHQQCRNELSTYFLREGANTKIIIIVRKKVLGRKIFW